MDVSSVSRWAPAWLVAGCFFSWTKKQEAVKRWASQSSTIILSIYGICMNMYEYLINMFQYSVNWWNMLPILMIPWCSLWTVFAPILISRAFWITPAKNHHEMGESQASMVPWMENPMENPHLRVLVWGIQGKIVLSHCHVYGRVYVRHSYIYIYMYIYNYFIAGLPPCRPAADPGKKEKYAKSGVAICQDIGPWNYKYV